MRAAEQFSIPEAPSKALAGRSGRTLKCGEAVLETHAASSIAGHSAPSSPFIAIAATAAAAKPCSPMRGKARVRGEEVECIAATAAALQKLGLQAAAIAAIWPVAEADEGLE